MRGAIFRLFFLILALAALVACRARTERPHDEARHDRSSEEQRRDPPHFAPGQLEQHFEKHGREMGIATKDDYLRAAQALVRGGPGVDTFERKNGDTLYFKRSTDEFGVLTKRNVIRTYFKPNDGPRYWERQKAKDDASE